MDKVYEVLVWAMKVIVTVSVTVGATAAATLALVIARALSMLGPAEALWPS